MTRVLSSRRKRVSEGVVEAGLFALYLDRVRMESGPDVVHDLREAAERVM
jgi:hypothetical protein